MTCPPIWQLISNKKIGLADRMQRERAWELPPRFTKQPLNALGVKVLMPLPVLRFLCFCSALSRVWLCNPTDCSMLGFPVLHCLSKVTQIRVHWVSDAILSSHPPLSSFLPALSLPHLWGLFHWVVSLHQVTKVLELQLQNLLFQWRLRVDFL